MISAMHMERNKSKFEVEILPTAEGHVSSVEKHKAIITEPHFQGYVFIMWAIKISHSASLMTPVALR